MGLWSQDQRHDVKRAIMYMMALLSCKWLPIYHNKNGHKSWHIENHHRAFRFVVWFSFVCASSNCDWLENITWFILPNHSCCLQKQLKIKLQVDRLYMWTYFWQVFWCILQINCSLSIYIDFISIVDFCSFICLRFVS